MEKDELDHYIKAGKVAAECLEYGKSLIKPGALMVDVLDKVEEKILSMGCGIAFPAQISFNDVAAHTCSGINDETEFSDQVVKIDIGGKKKASINYSIQRQTNKPDKLYQIVIKRKKR